MKTVAIRKFGELVTKTFVAAYPSLAKLASATSHKTAASSYIEFDVMNPWIVPKRPYCARFLC